jgi:hypothetical protein
VVAEKGDNFAQDAHFETTIEVFRKLRPDSLARIFKENNVTKSQLKAGMQDLNLTCELRFSEDDKLLKTLLAHLMMSARRYFDWDGVMEEVDLLIEDLVRFGVDEELVQQMLTQAMENLET